MKGVNDTVAKYVLVLTVVLLLGGTVSAAGPNLSFVTPSDGDTVSGTVWFNVTNTTGDMNDPNTTVNITRNDTLIGEDANLSTHFANISGDTTTWGSDGLFDINASAWNSSSGARYNYTSIQVTVDNTAPTITTFSPVNNANLSGMVDVNATATDAGTNVTNLTYRWINFAGDTVINSTSILDANDTVNTTTLDDGNYTINFTATDFFNQTNNSVYLNVTVDNTDPDVTSVKINDSSNTSTNFLTHNGVFQINASFSDETTSVYRCGVDAVKEGDWNDESYGDNHTANASMSLFTNPGVANGSVNLVGEEGNFTFNVECEDRANNTATNNTMEMFGGNLSGTRTSWFPMDDAGPHVNESTITVGWKSAANDSYTNETDPTISFNVTDFSEVNGSSLNVTFNGTEYNFSTFTENFSWTGYNDNETLNITFTPNNSLQNDTRYNVTVNATDGGGDWATDAFWFTTDFTKPTLSSVGVFEGVGGQATRDGTTWYKDEAVLQNDCSDSSDSSLTYSVLGSNGTDNTTTVDTEGKRNLTFAADSEVEKEFNLTVSCEDEGGNVRRNYTTVHLDHRDPQFVSIDPSDGDEISRLDSNLPYDQTITIEIEDNGIGFNTSNTNSSLWEEIEFENDDVFGYDLSIQDDNTTAEIEWTEEDLGTGTYDIDLDNIEDRFGHDFSDTWSFDVTEDTEVTTEDDSSSGGGGGGGITGSPDLEITSAPSTIEIEPDSSETVDVEVENTGDATADIDVSVSISGNDEIVNASSHFVAFTLDENETFTAELTVVTSEDFAGEGEVTITFDYDSDSVSKDITVREPRGPPGITISDSPGEVDIFRGNSTTLTFEVNNSGDRPLDGVEASFSRFHTSISPEQFDLDENGSEEVTVEVEVPENATIGHSNETFAVSHDNASDSTRVLFKIQPVEDEVKEGIERSMEMVETAINEIDNETKRRQYQQQLAEAQASLDVGDYATASSVTERLRTDIGEEATMQAAQGGFWSTLLQILLYVLISGGIIGGGVYGYIHYYQDDGGDDAMGYSPRGMQEIGSESLGDRVEDAWKKVKDSTEELFGNVKEMVAGIGGSSSSRETEDKPRRRTRKKIKFEPD